LSEAGLGREFSFAAPDFRAKAYTWRAMRTEAIVLTKHGGPEVLERATIDLGDLGAREVRVRVRAVALNHLDLWVRKGLPHLKLDYPHRLGSDIAGEIEAIGTEVRGAFRVGDRVLVAPGLSCGVCVRCASGQDNLCPRYRILGENAQGGYARFVNVPDENVIPLPARLSFEQAAAIPLVFLTAWQMVKFKAQVTHGQWVLVHAAGSGVSSAAIQMAKMCGGRVIATTGSDEKAERAHSIGAEHVINYATHDFVREVRRITDNRGADVVIDHVGGEVFSKSIAACAWGGQIVTCGATAGHSPDVDLRHVFFRQIAIKGSTMGPRFSLFSLVDWVQRGLLSPVVAAVLPWERAAEAHALLEGRGVFGKVVLSID
jgi:NADPH:quinone reductase-like Zn-dependent oxidoreductase